MASERKKYTKSWPVLGNDVNQCLMCRHLIKVGRPFDLSERATGWRCAAFGEEDIPPAIVVGFYDHRERWRSQPTDILFEDIPDAPITYEDLAGPFTGNDTD